MMVCRGNGHLEHLINHAPPLTTLVQLYNPPLLSLTIVSSYVHIFKYFIYFHYYYYHFYYYLQYQRL